MILISKRDFLRASAAAAALGAAGRARAQEMPAHERTLHEAARREGELTWYSGQYNAETSEAVGRAFTERYAGVRVNVVRSTSQVAFQRLSQDTRAGVAQCDVFSSTDFGHYSLLKRENRLLQYRPVNDEQLLPQLRRADPDGYYHTSFMGLYLMAHNTTKVSEADAPKKWTDVLDPRWRDQLAVGHPGFSGAIGIWAVQMRKMYGWDYFTRLERNRPQIGRSSMDPVTGLNAGERSVGIAVPSGTTLLSAQRGNPLRLIYPEEGVLATLSPSAIPRNAPHPNAAKLFMEFTASRYLSDTIRQTFGDPINPMVEPPPGSRAINDLKLIYPTQEEAERGVPEVRELWRDTFGV
ncbi:extracellular solute-binding protein [Roseomonas hellenica]|uniref:Extracellular solute-binding protein n=1 Tax=Plastoroseomonas hellenica TaxID=2687306 RepID=A0ABS5F2L8_9PROT|nr:extracellular solute-binding protein [Plastoroseomonas hellenica]MBR0666797.1 extracellular solute-binding protein [Plastoroseomonas hellenica]